MCAGLWKCKKQSGFGVIMQYNKNGGNKEHCVYRVQGKCCLVDAYIFFVDDSVRGRKEKRMSR